MLAERKMKLKEEEVDVLTGNDAEEVVEHVGYDLTSVCGVAAVTVSLNSR